ncbi:MAG: M81 family metallopeptidase [Pseudomonadota bacterium]
MTLRVFTAALATETNTFSPIATERRHFDEWFLYPAGQHPDDGPTLFTGPLWVARQRAKAEGWQLHEGLCAAAFPSGKTVREVYEDLRDELLSDLEAALPLDIVLLGLHGAMVAEGYDDCEGDLLQRVRQLVGPSCIIGVEFDPHAHLTSAMTDAADILIAFKEYPHTDALERAEELVDLAVRARRGDISPVVVQADTRSIAQYFTGQDPSRSLVQRMTELETQPSVLSVSLVHGFASGDVPDMGTKALVITDGDVDLAEEVAAEVADHAFRIRAQASTERLSVDESVDAAKRGAPGRPVVIADGADNPGGGAPGDSTYMLRALLEASVGNVAVGPIWDPVAVSIAAAHGEGATLDLRVGGKASSFSGMPLDHRVTVGRVIDDARQDFGGTSWPMGQVVAVHAGDLSLLLCTVRNQAFSTDLFEDAGIALAQKSVIVLKSNHHFFDSFSKLTDDIVYLAAPGVAVADPQLATYRKADTTMWPFSTERS